MHQEDKNKLPLYKQLKNMILEDIESGKLKQGDKILSERRIAELGNVSRMTARNALTMLEREGLVERRVGSGTYLARKIEMNFITFNSYSKELMLKGLKPSSKVLSIKKMKADLSIAKKLDIEVGDKVIIFERLRLGDDIPIAVEESYLPYNICEGIEDFIADNISLYEMLEERYGIIPVKADQYMQVILSNDYYSKLLTIKNGSACISIESTAFNNNNQIVEFTKSTTRSDIVRYYSRLNLKPMD